MTEAQILEYAGKLDNIVNGRLGAAEVVPILDYLEKTELTADLLSKSRIGMILNEFRKKTSDEKMAKRAKQLIKNWKNMIEPDSKTPKVENGARQVNGNKAENGVKNESVSRKTSAPSKSPSEPVEAKKPRIAEVKQEKVERVEKKIKQEEASTSNKSATPAPRNTNLKMPNDEARVKSVKVLTSSLQSGAMPMGSLNPEDLAIQIESCIFEIHGQNDKYSATVRSRIFNLRDKKNPALRENVLVGSVTPQRFAIMTSEEMASDDMKKMREKFTQEGINDCQMAVTEGTPSDMFKCGRCGRKNCTYNQMQTRSADEPMTTFVFCRDCGNRWKFC